MRINPFLLLLTAFPFSIIGAEPHPLNADAQARAARDYGKLPLQFEENAGQTDNSVKFLARGGGYTLALGADQAVMSSPAATLRMQMLGGDRQAEVQGLDALPGRVNYMIGKDAANWRTGIATYAKVKYEQLYPGIDLIFYGQDGRLEYDFVLAPGADPSTIRVGLNGASPRVDSNGNLVLTAGAEKVSFLKPILYQMHGTRKERVSGGFVLTGNHEVRFQVGRYDRNRALVIDPVLVYASYLGGQQQTNINGLAVNGLGQLYVTGFTSALNFPTTPGVVQPGLALAPDAFVSKISADGNTLLYSTYLGGNNVDSGTAIAVDGNDNAYITGLTQSNNFPITADAIQKQCGPQGVASTDPVTFQTVYKTTAPNCDSGNIPDVFLAKLNPTGTQLLYSTFLGGNGSESPTNIGLDLQGNVYLAGSTSSVAGSGSTIYPNGPGVNYPVTPSAFQSDVTGQNGWFYAFVTKLSPDLHSILYSSILGGENGGSAGNGTTGNFNQAMAVGQNGIVYIGGYTSSPQFPVTPGALQTACPLCTAGVNSGHAVDAGFISAFNTTQSGTASLAFSTYVDGTAPQNTTTIVHGLAADPQNNVYATGQTEANDFPVTSGAYSPTCSYPIANDVFGRCRDAFVLKLSPSGSLVWSTYYGSSIPYTTVSRDIAIDAAGNVYIAGGGDVLPGLPQVNPIQAGPTGDGRNLFLATLSMDGSKLLFASYYGGNGSDIPSGVGLDSSGNIYAAGTTTSSNLPATAGAVQTQDPGPAFMQGFFLKASCINPTCPALPSLIINSIGLSVNPNSAASGQPVTLTATVVGQPGKPTPTGSATFYNGATLVGQAPLNANGVATLMTSFLAPGSYPLTATYGGDSLYLGNTSAAQTLTISGFQTSTAAAGVSLTFSPNPQTVNLTATVTSGSGTVNAGSVMFTLLGMTVSGAVNNGSASASFTVPGGTAAGAYSIQAAYVPSAGFSGSSDNSKQLLIAKTTPVITFANPADITSGTALSSTQLNASANVAGTFVYSPPAGTVLPVGNGQTLTATFTPADTADYNGASGNALINVKSTAPNATSIAANGVSLTFSPNAQTVSLSALVSSNLGTPTGSVQFTALGTQVSGVLNNGTATASFTVPGGTATGSYPILAAYVPTGNFGASSDNSKQLAIAKATPVITWANPSDLSFGTVLGPAQLNATANVPGSFVYNPPAGTLLPVRDGQTLSTVFTPTDANDYTTATATALINVKEKLFTSTVTTAAGVSVTYSPSAQQIVLSATVTSGSGVVNGGSVTFTLLGATVSGPVNNGAAATYTLPAGTAAGNYPIQAAYTPAGNFNASSDNSKQLAVAKATPLITWSNPADIQAGTALSATQLNATANVPGTFVYNPPAGTVLPAGSGQTLAVTFTPTDSIDYKTATASVQINVKQSAAIATITKLITGVKLTTSPNSQPVVLSAVVTSPFGPLNGGSVQFTIGGATYSSGSAPVINGTATATLTLLGTDFASLVGFYPVTAVYFPDTTSNFLPSQDSQYALEVQVKIVWPTPANITFGTALSSDQLNATPYPEDTALGTTLTYNPSAGTVLPVGRHVLSVHFDYVRPSFGSLHGSADGSVVINVLPAASSGTWPLVVVSNILSRDPVTSDLLVQLTLSNIGGSTAINVQVSSLEVVNIRVGASAVPGQSMSDGFIASIAPGASSPPITFRVPGSRVISTGPNILVVRGSTAGSGWSDSSRITLP